MAIERKAKREQREQLLFEQEAFIVDCQEAIAQAIAVSGQSRSEIARRIGRDRLFITRALSHGRNLTLRVMASIAWAAGCRLDVTVTRK